MTTSHPFVHFREAPLEVGPAVRDTVSALDYVRADCAEQLIELFKELWPKGISALMLSGRDVRPRFFSMLSDTGASAPYDAARIVALRVISSVRRAEFDRDEPKWSDFSSKVRFRANGKSEYYCRDAIALDGMMFSRDKRFPVPLPSCDRQWCPCRWDLVPDDN
ncbi:MAG: hypothetical protein ACOY45_15530 [Pseudomonadota bacterium]